MNKRDDFVMWDQREKYRYKFAKKLAKNNGIAASGE